MSVTDLLGYANALLETLGIKGALVAGVIITVAWQVYTRFFAGRE